MTDLTMSQFASKDDLLAAQAARIAELESQLEAIGAGGVEPLRKREKLHQIAEPVTAGTAVRAFRDYLGVHDGIKLGGQAMDDMALDLARIALDFKHLVEPQHPDDAAVDALAVLMKAKLAKQRAKGYGGWNDKTQCPQQRLSDMLRAHVDKGDPVDVANFCAMLSARGEGIAAAPQAVQAAEPEGWKRVPIKPTHEMCHVGRYGGDKDAPAYGEKPAEGVTAWPFVADHTAEQIYQSMLAAAPAHPAEGVPAQASEWDGKLPERLQSVLNALRLELPAAVVNDVEFEVRSHYEAMHTSLSTSRRMYGAARDRLEAIDAAQPDPFAATQPAAQGMDALTPAARDVLAERQRQISAEGWTPESDDRYAEGDMSDAAGCYALHAFFAEGPTASPPAWWPWADQWWKPTTPRRDLEKAGALILAEIERIDRAALAAQAKQGGADHG